jgi:hypothetical protein
MQAVLVRVQCSCLQDGKCHTCQGARCPLSRCPGCEHHFCNCCVHRLDIHFVCDRCMSAWLGLMTKLDVPREVMRWFNAITLR